MSLMKCVRIIVYNSYTGTQYSMEQF